MPSGRFSLLFQAQYRIPDILQNVSPPSDADGRKERGQMSEEESRLRFEKAMATLAEISAQHDERLAAIERTNEILKALAADAHQWLANMQRRATGLEETNSTLVDLLGRQHEGITEMRAAQAHADARIAVLAESQANSDAKIAALAESQTHTDKRLDALIDIVRTRFNGQSESS
jgi:ABC-type transporter Mla subunit MlaD